jgi:hypothetical protein
VDIMGFQYVPSQIAPLQGRAVNPFQIQQQAPEEEAGAGGGMDISQIMGMVDQFKGMGGGGTPATGALTNSMGGVMSGGASGATGGPGLAGSLGGVLSGGASGAGSAASGAGSAIGSGASSVGAGGAAVGSAALSVWDYLSEIININGGV